jgi:hypothetical protein
MIHGMTLCANCLNDVHILRVFAATAGGMQAMVSTKISKPWTSRH